MIDTTTPAWSELLDELGEWQRDAFITWAKGDGSYSMDGDGLPDISEFEERFCGEWESFDQYADELFSDLGYASEMPEHLAAYFDMTAWARDLAFDYTTEPAPCGGVYVFRCI